MRGGRGMQWMSSLAMFLFGFGVTCAAAYLLDAAGATSASTTVGIVGGFTSVPAAAAVWVAVGR